MTSAVESVDIRARLARAIEDSELPKYVYGYPSKRAYQSLGATRSLERLWRDVRGPVNLYVHVPFCAYRCSFCTLFLTTSHDADLRQRYVEALQRQIRLYGRLLPDVEVVSLYIGGGTPTSLEPDQFEALFATLYEAFPTWASRAEVAVEGSPDTLTSERITVLRALASIP